MKSQEIKAGTIIKLTKEQKKAIDPAYERYNAVDIGFKTMCLLKLQIKNFGKC